jgi:hypothetical protein
MWSSHCGPLTAALAPAVFGFGEHDHPTTTGSSAVGLWVDIRRAPDRRAPFADLVAATIG